MRKTQKVQQELIGEDSELLRRRPAPAGARRQRARPTRSSVTLGPKGRNVVLDKKFGAPTITNDGRITDRKGDRTRRRVPRTFGAQLVKEVATKTNDIAGDGTTTATVLAQAMVRDGLRNVAARRQPDQPQARHGRRCRGGQRRAAREGDRSRRQRRGAHVATILGQDPEIGKLIAEAMDAVGREGVITVEDGSTMATELEITRRHAVRQGLQFAVLHDRPGGRRGRS